MATAFGLPQIASLYDPSVAVDQAALERQMAIAQALRQQSMTPVDTAGRQIGGMGYKISPWEGVAKMVQAVMAGKQDQENDQSRLELQQRMAKALQQYFPQGGQPSAAPTGAPGPAPSGGAAPAPSPGGGIGLPDMIRQGLTESIGGSALAGATAKNFEPTDFARALRSSGVDPNSALGQKLQQDQIAKLNNIPAENIRPGGYQRNPVTGQVTQFPQVPAGFQSTQGPNGFSIAPVDGGPAAVQSSAKASAAGAAGAIPEPTVNAQGQPQPLRSRAQVLGLEDAQIPPEVQAGREATRQQMLAAELRKEPPGTPAGKAIQTEINAGASYAAPPLGTSESQSSLDKKWEALQTQNREAQTTSSYLDNIVTAAHKGAIIGPGADRREMIQGMLQLAGINETVNTNATTQTQLLDKYSNQIVARLGQGGLGTDAARAILSSAYPGQHMNLDAIDEASSNLKGAQAMVQAKTRFLSDSGNKRDSTGYSQKEIAFDQAADPRLFQYRALQGDAKKAFAKQLMQQDSSAADRIAALEKMGAW